MSEITDSKAANAVIQQQLTQNEIGGFNFDNYTRWHFPLFSCLNILWSFSWKCLSLLPLSRVRLYRSPSSLSVIFHTRACHVASLSSSIILSRSNNRIFKILIFLVYLQRNQLLAQDAGAKTSLPSAWKTGTTIVGMIYKDGVVLGADTRATGGSEVVDKVRILYLIKVTYPCKITYIFNIQ